MGFVKEILEATCFIDNVENCSEEEKKYIEEIKAKTPSEIEKEMRSLNLHKRLGTRTEDDRIKLTRYVSRGLEFLISLNKHLEKEMNYKNFTRLLQISFKLIFSSN